MLYLCKDGLRKEIAAANIDVDRFLGRFTDGRWGQSDVCESENDHRAKRAWQKGTVLDFLLVFGFLIDRSVFWLRSIPFLSVFIFSGFERIYVDRPCHAKRLAALPGRFRS